jgi:hypothetical protein
MCKSFEMLLWILLEAFPRQSLSRALQVLEERVFGGLGGLFDLLLFRSVSIDQFPV